MWKKTEQELDKEKKDFQFLSTPQYEAAKERCIDEEIEQNIWVE